MKVEIPVSTAGTAGTATGAASVAVPLCELVALYIDYHASAPATTDVTISAPGNPAAQTPLTVSNSATDGWYYPRRIADGLTGAALSTHAPYVVHGGVLAVSVAQSDALTDCVTVTAFLRPL